MKPMLLIAEVRAFPDNGSSHSGTRRRRNKTAQRESAECPNTHAPGGEFGSHDRRYFSTENANTVCVCSITPGFSSVLGNAGWFGESGKCCVSKQSPACFANGTPAALL